MESERPSADVIVSDRLRAAAPALYTALIQASTELSILKSVILCGESWSPTLDESYRITREQISAALSVAAQPAGEAQP